LPHSAQLYSRPISQLAPCCPTISVFLLFVVRTAATGIKQCMTRSCRIILSGTPVRAEFGTVDRHAARRSLNVDNGEALLTVVGGSSGSDQLSSAFLPIVPILLRSFPKLHIHHQRGPGVPHALKMTTCAHKRYHETSFFKNMADQFAASDLVLARSGALTCAEVLRTGVPSILWPLVPSADNHQAENAKAMVCKGASILFRETDKRQCSHELLELLSDILNRHGCLSRIRLCGFGTRCQSAAERVVRDILRLVQHRYI